MRLGFFPAGYLNGTEEASGSGTDSPAEMQQLQQNRGCPGFARPSGSAGTGRQTQVVQSQSVSVRGWLGMKRRSLMVACLCAFICAFCLAQAALRVVASAPNESGTSDTVEQRLASVEPETPLPPDPIVDGSVKLSKIKTVPGWCRSFFRHLMYVRMPLGGVIDPEKIRTGRTPWRPREAGRGMRGRSTFVEEGEETRLHRDVSTSTVASDDETCGKDEGYRHLLHEILTEHGDISDFQYFVSDDEIQPSDEQAQNPHMVVMCRIGRKTCAHKGVVHGGFTAALLDNSVSYLAHLLFKRAATKSLNVKYFRPLLAQAFTLVDVEIESVDKEAGTAVVVGTVYTEIPEKLRKRSPPKSEKQKPKAGKNLPEGVWAVAVGRAVMVDVTDKWTEF